MYSYDGVTVSINFDPLHNLDYLKSSYIECEKEYQNYSLNSNIYYIIEETKARSTDDIKNLIQSNLLAINQYLLNKNINKTECYINDFHKFDNDQSIFDDTHDIIKRRKYLKLTTEQIAFLKSKL